MNIIAVDDEHHALQFLEREIRKVVPDCTLAGFTSAEEALEYVSGTADKGESIDFAFLDLNMPVIDGKTLAKRLKEINEKIKVIFVTGESEHALNALGIPKSGYLLKPVGVIAIAEKLGYLREDV